MANPFDEFVGIPWKRSGCSMAGADCWGLVRLVFQNHLRICLPAVLNPRAVDPSDDIIASHIAANKAGWIEIPSGHEQMHDVVLMRMKRATCHIGVVVRPGYLLHVQEDGPSLIVNYDTPLLVRRLVGFYRHPSVSETIYLGRTSASRRTGEQR